MVRTRNQTAGRPNGEDPREVPRLRFSTAATGVSPYFAHLVADLPAGLILNLGAGTTGASDGPQLLVNVDHMAPRGPRAPGLLVVADAHRLPFGDGAFAGALAKDVLEHVEDPIGVLEELRRTTRPGGRLVVVVPRAIPRAVWDDPTHVRRFTERALGTALRLSGWSPSGSIRRLGGFPGADRLGLVPHLETLMRIPGLGHWFGLNWVARATSTDRTT